MSSFNYIFWLGRYAKEIEKNHSRAAERFHLDQAKDLKKQYFNATFWLGKDGDPDPTECAPT